MIKDKFCAICNDSYWNSMFENFSIGDYRKISQDKSQSIDYILKGKELLCQ